MSGTIWTGTSGWAYEHWRDRFYPPGMRRRDWFTFYASRFPTVEINATFYGLPSAATVERWRAAAPPGFRYAAKGSRLITHVRRLAGCEAAVRTFHERLLGLGPSLAVLLWQLPPSLERDVPRLAGFLAILPPGVRHAIEFRHPSWHDKEVYGLLERHGAALVAVSALDVPANRHATAGFVYVRCHGLSGGYAHDYSAEELAPWASWLGDMASGGRDGYVYFNNDGLAHAPENATRLTEMLSAHARSWRP